MDSAAIAARVLPIVTGLQAIGEYSDADGRLLAGVLEAQFRTRRQRYAHSGFVLLLEAPVGLTRSLTAVAQRIGMTVIDAEHFSREDEVDTGTTITGSYFDGNALRRKPHAERSWMAACHVLYLIQRNASGQTGSTLPIEFEEGLAGETDASNAFETKAGTEIIRLALIETATDSSSIRRIAESDAGASEHAGSAAVMQRTDDFNERAAALLQSAPETVDRDDLVPPPLPGEMRPGERYRQAYAVADELAVRYQRHVRHAFQFILLLALAGAVSYGLFSNMTDGDLHLQTDFLLPYLLLLAAAYGVFYLAKKRSVHDGFVEHRALAEALRVQYYWSAAGLQACAADALSHEQRVGLAWIRLALRALYMTSLVEEGNPVPAGNIGAVLSHWVLSQKHYFAQTYEVARRRSRNAKIVVRTIFVAGAVAAVAVILQSRVPLLRLHHSGISLMSFLCPSFATALATYINKIGWTYQAQHSVRMLNIYARAEQLLVDAALPATQLALALGREALRENEAWAVFRSERSIEAPSSPFKKPI